MMSGLAKRGIIIFAVFLSCVLLLITIFQKSGTSTKAESKYISDRQKSGMKAKRTPRFSAGGLEIAIAIKPEIPRVGGNTLHIEVVDATGNPLTEIDIEAYAEMPAMGSMPAMRATAGLAQIAPGRYEGELDLSMRGEWPLTINISESNGQKRRLQFDFATDRAGLTIASGGVPVGRSQSAISDNEYVINIDNRRRQLIGVKTQVVTHRDMNKEIRAVGEVTYDERNLSQIALKFDGYIGDLKANYVGTKVTKGEELFTVYSPELLAAQQEYLEIIKRSKSRRTKNRILRSSQDNLVQAVRQRLSLWDMTSSDIKQLEKRGTPQSYVSITAPRNGTVIERYIADGSAASRGQTLLKIADLSQVWIEAEIFEADLELVQVGMKTTVRLPYLKNRSYTATVEYIYPYLHQATRTGKIRLTLDNPRGELKPGMYAEVSLRADLGHQLSIPENAVLVAGESRIVFVDLGAGQLKPVWIKTGNRSKGFIEVISGLSLGDVVVTSGNFLIAAETRLKAGIEQW
jgi:Cu(I)/Ag(I) efflux system membrane fusion protein